MILHLVKPSSGFGSLESPGEWTMSLGPSWGLRTPERVSRRRIQPWDTPRTARNVPSSLNDQLNGETAVHLQWAMKLELSSSWTPFLAE